MSTVSTVFSVLIGFALAVVSVVLGNFLYDILRERRKRLQLDFSVKQETERLGISVRCRYGYQTNARARLNGVEYDWETSDGGKPEKNILAGDDPSVFYPLKHSARWIDAKDLSSELKDTSYTPMLYPVDAPVKGAVMLALTDVRTGEMFWNHAYILGGDAVSVMVAPGSVLPGEFPIFIRIIAREIVDEEHYVLGLGAPLEVIDLDREKPIIRYNFLLRQKQGWWGPKSKVGRVSGKS